jgi:secreted trypsin-like serine protease
VTLNRAQNDTGILRQVTTALTSEDSRIRRFTVGQFFRGACAGDSGGPAYVQINGDHQLAGATSTGAEFLGTCLGLINNYTDVRYYKDWISSISVEETGLSL